MESKRIKLEHTETEWALLEEFATSLGFANFRAMFNSNMRKLNITFKTGESSLILPPCIECNNKRSNFFDVDMELIKKLEGIADPYCFPVTSIIRYFTTHQPLIVERLDKHF